MKSWDIPRQPLDGACIDILYRVSRVNRSNHQRILHFTTLQFSVTTAGAWISVCKPVLTSVVVNRCGLTVPWTLGGKPLDSVTAPPVERGGAEPLNGRQPLQKGRLPALQASSASPFAGRAPAPWLAVRAACGAGRPGGGPSARRPVPPDLRQATWDLQRFCRLVNILAYTFPLHLTTLKADLDYPMAPIRLAGD